MAAELHDIQPDEVSLVRRGANRLRFLLAKGDEYDVDVAAILKEPSDGEELMLAAVKKSGGDEGVLKATATAARALAALRDAYGDAGIPDTVMKATRKQMAQDMADDDLENGDDTENQDDDETDDEELEKTAAVEQPIYKRDFTAEQRRDLAKKGHALPNGSYPIDSKADIGPAVTLASSGHGDTDAAKALIKRRAKDLGAEDQLPDSWNVNKEDRMSETAQPVKKADGSWDLSMVPEEQRAGVEVVLKAQEDELAELRKSLETESTKADQAIEIAKAERETRETTEYIAKAATLDHLSVDKDEFGPVLKAIAAAERDEHLPKGTVEALDTVLKAANEAVEKGVLFAEIGRAGGVTGPTDSEAKVEGIAKALREADPKLTAEQAYTKALDQNPSLYEAIRKEQA